MLGLKNETFYSVSVHILVVHIKVQLHVLQMIKTNVTDPVKYVHKASD